MDAFWVIFYHMYAQAADVTTLAEEAATQFWIDHSTPTTLSTWVDRNPQGV